jgi:PAS domain S-box-containing protein
VTKPKAAESELAQQKVFIEELLDSIPNLIFVKDGNDRVIYCNKAVERICGINRDLLTGSTGPFMQIVYPNASTYATIENKVINEGQEILIEEKIIDHQRKNTIFKRSKSHWFAAMAMFTYSVYLPILTE